MTETWESDNIGRNCDKVSHIYILYNRQGPVVIKGFQLNVGSSHWTSCREEVESCHICSLFWVSKSVFGARESSVWTSVFVVGLSPPVSFTGSRQEGEWWPLTSQITPINGWQDQNPVLPSLEQHCSWGSAAEKGHIVLTGWSSGSYYTASLCFFVCLLVSLTASITIA